MPVNSKIKVKDENDKTLLEVKLNTEDEKKPNYLLRLLLVIVVLAASVGIGYLLHKIL